MTWINNAAEATQGFNIYASLAAGGITLLVLALRNVVLSFKASAVAAAANAASMTATGAAATTAASGISMMNIALGASVLGVAVLTITTLVGALADVGKMAREAAKRTSELAESLSGERGNNDD